MNRLFRHITRLALAGIILTVVGCAYEDTFRDVREQGAQGDDLAISFSNGVIENPVKKTRAVTLLSGHTHSMGVWGWLTTPEGDTERLFINQEVTFSAPEAKWTYSPVKYWEQRNTYRFCAYAPHSSQVPDVKFSIDSATHAFSFKGVTLQGCNTIDGGVPELPSNFSNVADVDWMIDRTGQSMAGINRSEVVFNMQHILSKICVRLRRGNYQPASKITVVIDSLRIGDFICQGDFTQALTDSAKALAAEWTPIDTLPRYTLTAQEGVTVPDQPIYVIESLLIPQSITQDQTLSIWYRIGKPGHYMSRMDDSISLKSLFGRVEAGKNYVITITIGPEPIKFDAGVQDWNNHAETENALENNQ